MAGVGAPPAAVVERVGVAGLFPVSSWKGSGDVTEFSDHWTRQ